MTSRGGARRRSGAGRRDQERPAGERAVGVAVRLGQRLGPAHDVVALLVRQPLERVSENGDRSSDSSTKSSKRRSRAASRPTRRARRRTRPPRAAPAAAPGRPARTSRARPDRRARCAELDQRAVGIVAHGFSSARPTPPARPARRAQHPPHLPHGRGRIDGEHVPPPAQDASTLAVGRSIHSSSSRLNSTFSFSSRARGPLARDLEHRLGRVAGDQRPARRDQLGGEEAGVPRAGGELEHPLAGLKLELLDHPGRHRHPELAHALRAPAPPGRGPLPPSRISARSASGSVTPGDLLLRSLSALRQAARDLLNAPSIWLLRRRWKIAITASDATGPSRCTACSISGHRSAGMSACANGFQISCRNSSTNDRDTESQWRSMSSSTDSALRARFRARPPPRRSPAATGWTPRTGRRRWARARRAAPPGEHLGRLLRVDAKALAELVERQRLARLVAARR